MVTIHARFAPGDVLRENALFHGDLRRGRVRAQAVAPLSPRLAAFSDETDQRRSFPRLLVAFSQELSTLAKVIDLIES
jgi:hypothetical protein